MGMYLFYPIKQFIYKDFVFLRICLGKESKHDYPWMDAQTLTPTLLDMFSKRFSKFSTMIYCTKIINKTFCTDLTLLGVIKGDVSSSS